MWEKMSGGGNKNPVELDRKKKTGGQREARIPRRGATPQQVEAVKTQKKKIERPKKKPNKKTQMISDIKKSPAISRGRGKKLRSK